MNIPKQTYVPEEEVILTNPIKYQLSHLLGPNMSSVLNSIHTVLNQRKVKEYVRIFWQSKKTPDILETSKLNS